MISQRRANAKRHSSTCVVVNENFVFLLYEYWRALMIFEPHEREKDIFLIGCLVLRVWCLGFHKKREG